MDFKFPNLTNGDIIRIEHTLEGELDKFCVAKVGGVFHDYCNITDTLRTCTREVLDCETCDKDRITLLWKHQGDEVEVRFG